MAHVVRGGVATGGTLADALPGPTAGAFEYLFGLLHEGMQARYRQGLVYLNQALDERSVGHFYGLDEERQDYVLCDIVLEGVEEQALTVQQGRDLVAAVQKRFLGRRKFMAAFSLLRAFASQKTVVQAAPFPATVLYALVVMLTVSDRERIAVALLVALTGLLRISEALNLTWEDVVFPNQHRAGARIILLLRKTKRGITEGERVVLEHPGVVAYLERYRELFYQRQQFFCRATYSTLTRWMQRGVEALGFSPDAFRTHSCRRGGATALALAYVPLAEIQHRGRWSSERSCREYIKKGEVLLLRWQAGISDNEWRRLERIAAIGEKAFELRNELRPGASQ